MSLTRRGFFGAVAAVVVACRFPPAPAAAAEVAIWPLGDHARQAITLPPSAGGWKTMEGIEPRIYAINSKYLYPPYDDHFKEVVKFKA